ncbi:nitrogen regulation protein NR(I) [Thiomicrorhabdus sp. 6S3-12]|uniref:nitrogen regulation protein NR(I) n=1 Tax=Thiomicrorhabdus sp. 6S3-12 TaxID=2819681 RepID=UPI001AACD966|nr:nitrogen regulation protein NR(I) [Thiomicrorhabdus sp. 6S3-12]MBO1924316.1 nitrogen regulation protein NR(I) [Thiomicrorhabdus sp. 6S3-12]
MSEEMEVMPIVWVVDDDASIRWVLEAALEDKPYIVKVFDSPLMALKSIEDFPPSAVLSDVRMPDMDGLTFMEAIHEKDKQIPVIIMTAHADLDTAVKSYQSEAFEYLPKPFDIDEATSLIERAVKRYLSGGMVKSRRSNKASKQPLNIIGGAPAMQEVFRVLGRVSKLDVTVLINGETGTGKELVARALHELSPRSEGPFVALNTAAIPRELLESELFGHEKGAFTGAHSQRIGRFEQADGGTLFLDEIGDMPVDLQTRLLRVLNDGSFYRVGGRNPIHTNVRIVAATHQNMEKLVREGRFREDLLYRLNIIRIKVPALRERREDIPLLARYYLEQEAKALGLEEKTLSKEVEKFLSAQQWPGNVRQLRSLCTWLTIMAPDKTVYIEDLPLELQEPSEDLSGELENDNWETPLRRWAQQFLSTGKEGLHTSAEPKFETVLIQESLKASGQHKQKAAALLGWGRNTLTRKMQALGLED